MTTATRTHARTATPSTSPAIGTGSAAATELTVAVLDPATTRQSERVEARLAAREERATWLPGAGRVELFRYRDLAIRIASGAAAVGDRPSETALADRFGIRLERPRPFYSRQLTSGPAPAGACSAIVVNRMAPRHRDRVAELFADLDATDFPSTMGTRIRRLYSVAPDIYLHVQEFEQVDGLGVIDEAWRDSDPRFLKIVADLTPLVPPYDDNCTSHEDHLAERFFVRSVP